MEEAFNHSSHPVEASVLAPTVVLPRRVHRDDSLHASGFDCSNDAVGVVAGVGDERFAGRMLNQMLGFRRVVLLPRCQDDVERLAFGSRDRVDFGRKTSSRTAQSVALDPPFPPAASWCARITEPSMSEPTSSTSIRCCLKSRSHIPRFAHRSNRLYTVFQLPYRSGISRQGAPVFTRHITALTKSRSPRSAGGPRLIEMSGSTCFHCSSVNSCRCIGSIDQLFDQRATMICQPHSRPNFPPPAPAPDHEIRDTP